MSTTTGRAQAGSQILFSSTTFSKTTYQISQDCNPLGLMKDRLVISVNFFETASWIPHLRTQFGQANSIFVSNGIPEALRAYWELPAGSEPYPQGVLFALEGGPRKYHILHRLDSKTNKQQPKSKADYGWPMQTLSARLWTQRPSQCFKMQPHEAVNITR